MKIFQPVIFIWKHKKLSLSILVIILLGYSANQVGKFFNTYRLGIQSPLILQAQNFIHLAYREEIQTGRLIIKETKANTPLTETQQYICDKFGKDCKTALAVAKAENGTWQCDRFNINTNGTVDFGIFQINTVHLKKGYKLSELIDCKKNIDIAFELYKQQGWTPWVAFNNKAYLKFMY